MVKIPQDEGHRKPDKGRELADRLVYQREVLHWGPVRIYAYWAWRCVLFALFIVAAVNLDFRAEQILSLEHISILEWATVLLVGLLGPAIFVGWSFIWAKWKGLLERHRL
jgi:hypothetical protein